MDVWRPGELGPHRVASVSPQYEKALLRGYVESCSNLTWCTNPQGCDRILCRQGLGCGTTCSKCGWASCFSCSFPEVGACPAMPLSTACTPPLPALLSITHTHTYIQSQATPCHHTLPPARALFLLLQASICDPPFPCTPAAPPWALAQGSAMSYLPPPALGTLPCQLQPHVPVGR